MGHVLQATDDLFWTRQLASAPTETQRTAMKQVLERWSDAMKQRYGKKVEEAMNGVVTLINGDRYRRIPFVDGLNIWSSESVFEWHERANWEWYFGRDHQLSAALKHLMKMHHGLA